MNLNLSAQRAARDQSEDYCRPEDVLVYRDTPQGIVGTPIVNEGRATQHLTLGQMTPDERKAAVKRAVRKVGAELKANAPAIAKVLQDFDREHAADAERVYTRFYVWTAAGGDGAKTVFEANDRALCIAFVRALPTRAAQEAHVIQERVRQNNGQYR